MSFFEPFVEYLACEDFWSDSRVPAASTRALLALTVSMSRESLLALFFD